LKFYLKIAGGFLILLILIIFGIDVIFAENNNISFYFSLTGFIVLLFFGLFPRNK